MEKISVTLITLNEEKNIARCLESLRWADEIVVVDSYSRDRTVDICRRFTDKVFQEPWRGYGGQKNFCASKARHRWILNIDADEVVPPATAKAIQAILDNPADAVYELPRKNFFGGRFVRFGGWYPDHIARLYDKEQAAFTDSQVHESLSSPAGTVGRLEEPLLHYTYEGREDYLVRQDRYSTLFAEARRKEGFRAGITHLYFRPLWAFIRAYLLRQGFREGGLGFFLALGAAHYTYLKYAKTRSP